MRVGSVAIAYHEPRLVAKHIRHLPSWIDEKLVLVSTTPWQGESFGPDDTEILAMLAGAHAIPYAWPTEHEQRNAGQEWFFDMDWIIILDPDEFLSEADWEKLRGFLEDAEGDAYVCDKQLTYWKTGYVIDPPEDYKQIIAVRPTVRFFDKRCVNVAYNDAPVLLHHMSWARTDDEIWKKISTYSHADEFDKKKWFENIWLRWNHKRENLHPLTPPALKRAIPATLPKELEELELWPTK